ncbi:alpha/beta hydrolase family protein [Micromonospora sp. AKA38]|uniref:hypothetical protein n=1 Tax=Micromonospora sp. AKA38 TaxID=2733861 RepID=UPI002492C307|nr:hypothetical protein [Micromonospora sp. AKA38]
MSRQTPPDGPGGASEAADQLHERFVDLGGSAGFHAGEKLPENIEAMTLAYVETIIRDNANGEEFALGGTSSGGRGAGWRHFARRTLAERPSNGIGRRTAAAEADF